MEGECRINNRTKRCNALSGLTHECGVFGAIGNENWPKNSEIAQIIGIGLEALQHRYVHFLCKSFCFKKNLLGVKNQQEL